MQSIILLLALSVAAPADEKLEPWASKGHPDDVARRHVQDIAGGEQQYSVHHGGTMDGTNCRTPIGGGFGIWGQSWESNRAVRLENVGTQDVINPWLANGRNGFRSMAEMVAGAVKPGMSDREKAIALWRLQTTHRFHASSGDNEVNDPVKVFNVYGYTTCGNDSICLAGLWRAAGMQVRPARCPGHCIPQVFYEGRWHLLDGDMGPFYLLRDNVTIASEQDLVRDHDLVRRSHTGGILDPDSRATAEAFAGLFIAESEWKGSRDSVRDTTMNMVLRPGEALVWRWGHRVPVRYHGRLNVSLWGPRSDGGKVWGGHGTDRICNGLWEYRPDFTAATWRNGAEKVLDIKTEGGALTAQPGKTGVIIWKMRSPYPFIGGNLDVDGSGASFALSWDGSNWHDLSDGLDPMFHFPHKGEARYEYRLKCDLQPGATLRRLAIANDVQMAPLALPDMIVGDNVFTYSDQSQERQVRITHDWVERSLSKPPAAPPAPIHPADGAEAEGTDIVFQWQPPAAVGLADFHFELSDRPDLAWPLSANFEKLISNTSDRGRPRYTLPQPGLLTPGQKYSWHVRARSCQGVWGPWSKTWSFTPQGPTPPLNVRLEPLPGSDGSLVLRWQPGSIGRQPVRYRIYASDEKGFAISDAPIKAARTPNFVAETPTTEHTVIGADHANKAFYRVVAIDDAGKRSGPSDYAAAPRPFIYTSPVAAARAGVEYRTQLATIRSLGDLRQRTVDGKTKTGFWDTEKPHFTLTRGPSWLRLDEESGVLSGIPDAPGSAEVVITATLDRPVRRLDDGRLSWGHEQVIADGQEQVGRATQQFRITVEK